MQLHATQVNVCHLLNIPCIFSVYSLFIFIYILLTYNKGLCLHVCEKEGVCETNETMQKCVEVKNLFTYQEESFLLLGMFQFT